MAKNLTEVIVNFEPNHRKEFHQVTSYRGKIFILTNTLIYDMVVTFFFAASLKSRLIEIYVYIYNYFYSYIIIFLIEGKNMIYNLKFIIFLI